MAILDRGLGNRVVELKESPSLAKARQCFGLLDISEQTNYKKSAKAAVKIIDRLEPKLFGGQGKLVIGLQSDEKGKEGDVRDVLCVGEDNWQVGLSCKHNHGAVKHSRLSDTNDFGKEWLGKACSKQYFEEVCAVFEPLRKMKAEEHARGKTRSIEWSEIPDKEDRCYVPVLRAFIKELKRLDKENPGEIPGLMVKYLVGREDFYKIIMNDKRRYTEIDSVNINGTLSKPQGKKKAVIDAPLMKMPTKFYEIGFKDDSKNTIFVVCDHGWNISMRIHNASLQVEPSLKFDVQLLAMPSSILRQIEPW